MNIFEWELQGCYYTNKRTSESLSKEDFEVMRDHAITELARQVVVTSSGVAIDYVPADLPVVLLIKEHIKAFLEVKP